MCRIKPPYTATLVAAAVTMAGASACGQLALLDFEDGMTGPIYGADVFTGGSTVGAPKPRLTVADDAAGLGSGNALFVESAGNSSELMAFLANPLTIGPNVGDGIAMAFDWRLNGSASAQGLPLDTGDFRFGFFSDTDNSIGSQFGTFSTYDEGGVLIADDNPAIFGSTGGDFDVAGGPIDPDYGIHVRTDFNRFVTDPNALPTSELQNQFQNVRVREENPGASGIFSGSGDTIIAPSWNEGNMNVNNLREGGTNYGELRDGNANSFLLELFRDNNGSEDIIVARFTVTNALGTTVFDNTDPFSQMNETTFDYIGFENSVGDFDYVIDNLRVYALPEGSVGLEGDYNSDGFVSQGDLDLVLLNWGDAVAPAGFNEDNIPGGGPFDSLMSQNELDGVLLNWGDGTPPLTAVPEPTSLALLGLGGLAMLKRRRA